MEKGLIKQVKTKKSSNILHTNPFFLSQGGGSQLSDDLHEDDRRQGGRRRRGRGRRRGKSKQHPQHALDGNGWFITLKR